MIYKVIAYAALMGAAYIIGGLVADKACQAHIAENTANVVKEVEDVKKNIDRLDSSGLDRWVYRSKRQ